MNGNPPSGPAARGERQRSTAMRSLLISCLYVFGAAPYVVAQYTQDLFDLKQLQESYDERGFAESAIVNVDGKLIVNNSNGLVSYSYPIARYTRGGVPINVELNYAGRSP